MDKEIINIRLELNKLLYEEFKSIVRKEWHGMVRPAMVDILEEGLKKIIQNNKKK